MNFNKKIFRSEVSTIIAGVCGAIAGVFDVNAKVVRIAYVAFTVFTAIFPGVFLYLFLMLLIPRESAENKDLSAVDSSGQETAS